MNRFVRIFNTSIGCKLVMALTGLLLLLFVIGHLLGNLQIYAGQEQYNAYAYFLKSLGPWLWVVRLGLLTVFCVHIYAGLRLQRENREARPNPYAYETIVQQGPAQARVRAATYMWLSGLVILAFVIYHLAHFTLGWINADAFRSPREAIAVESADYGLSADKKVFLDKETGRLVSAQQNGVYLDSQGRHDVYRMFIDGFRAPLISLLYVVAQLCLGAHLMHGVTSMFQTAGVRQPLGLALVRYGGPALVALVVLGNCLMPLTILLFDYPA